MSGGENRENKDSWAGKMWIRVRVMTRQCCDRRDREREGERVRERRCTFMLF